LSRTCANTLPGADDRIEIGRQLPQGGRGLSPKIFAYISPICREAPHRRMCIKFCTGGHLADIINRAKFYLNQIRGFDSVGVEFLAFPYERDVAVYTWLVYTFSLHI